MQWLWTWGGDCFGYRQQDNLWTHDGRHVGRFYSDEVYSPAGNYLGEIKSGNRLITNISKKHRIKPMFTPYGSRGGYVRHTNYVGHVMYVGHEDFPIAEEL